MQKFIRIMAIVSVVLIGISLLSLMITYPFQRLMGTKLFSYPQDIISALPQFPLVQFLSCTLQLGFAGLLILSCRNEKGGIWLEAVSLAFLAVVLPVCSQIATPFFNQLYLNLFGLAKDTSYLMARSIVNSLANYCVIFANVGRGIACMTCGMSIAFKRMSKTKDA